MAEPPHPSLAALRAFAVAGRLQSFRDAALELRVTPSSISQHVRVVEEWVGAPLFERGIRQVRLTPRGEVLAVGLKAGFDAVASALQASRAPSEGETLRVSTLPLFAQVWLIPRLARFQTAHPGLSIEVDTSSRVVDIEAGEADVGIRNLRQPSTGLMAHKLMDVRAVPLCAPTLATQLKGPADLARVPLIHISSRRDGWEQWLSAIGHSGVCVAPGRAFDTIPSAVQAAALGQGVVLALDPLIWDTPEAASLVVPFATSPVTAGTYFLVHRRADRARASVRQFTDWITREVRRDMRRLRLISKQRSAS